MSSGRVGGSNPADPGKGPDARMDEHRRVEKIEKVRSVDETENERTRKRFRSHMDDEEMGASERTPGPFESGFYDWNTASPLEDLENNAVPDPSYSPPPDATIVPEEHEEHSPLPKSHKFWGSVDNSDEAKGSPKFKETKKSASHGKETFGKKQKTSKKEEESIFGPPGKAVLQKKEEMEKAKMKASLKEKKQIPLQGAASSEKWKEAAPIKKEVSPKEKKEKEEAILLTGEMKERHWKESGEDKKQGGKKFRSFEIEPASLTPLPSSVAPLAQEAAFMAAPSLTPQTASLFFQMVGTIYVMCGPKGVSRTEILLNAPSLANSKFFGATISITKYATAPDSLNILLTGNNEAVAAFNKNIPNLYAAFQNGNFNFRIGRISAEYTTEKPIFRRKEEGEGKGDKRGQR